jgi:hypothetical protein
MRLLANSSEESDVKGKTHRSTRRAHIGRSGRVLGFDRVAQGVAPATQGRLSTVVEQILGLHVERVYDWKASMYFLERGVPLF